MKFFLEYSRIGDFGKHWALFGGGHVYPNTIIRLIYVLNFCIYPYTVDILKSIYLPNTDFIYK
jgi:hypothetical protein